MKPFESLALKPFLAVAALALVVAGVTAFAAAPARAQDEAAPDTTAQRDEAAAADETAAEETAAAEEVAFDPWAPGRQWMSVRAGYAKSVEDSSGHGAAGYGMSYSRMLTGLKLYKWTFFRRWSLGASVQHDLLGRFGPAAEVEVSAFVEMIRHYRWSPNVRPYLGFGVGPNYRKTYRTGNDLRDASLAWHITSGLNTPVSGRHVLGVDFRWSRLDGKNDPPNPVFGLGSVDSETSTLGVTTFKEKPVSHWSVKVNYAFTY